MTDYKGAFTGGRKTQNFGISQANKGTTNNNFQQPQDRLVVIDKYDLANRAIYCTDVKDGRKMIAHVNPLQYAKDVEYYAKNPRETYNGPLPHSIDTVMEKEYPLKSRVILKYTKILKKDDGAGFSVCEMNGVRGVTNQEEDKTFYSLIGVRLRLDEEGYVCVARASLFDREVAIDFNDEETVNATAKLIDDNNSVSSRMVGDFPETLPSYAVQYRALMLSPDKDANGQDKYIRVNSSTHFDWMDGPEVVGEDGKPAKSKGHPLTGQEFLSYFEDYAEYIESHPAYKDHVANMRIEAVLFRSAPGSRNKNLRIGHKDDEKTKKMLMYKLGSTPCFVDEEQTTMINHDNYVVRGIVQFSANKLEKVNGKPVEIQSYWVNNLHINGFKGDVHAFIRTSDGLKVESAPKLKLQYDFDGAKATAGQSGQAAESAAPAPQAPAAQRSAPAAQPASEVADADAGGEDDPFEYFGNSSSEAEPEQESKSSGGRRGRFSS